MTPQELEQSIRSLMQRPMADAELREQIEKLADAEVSFSGFTWLFGPELYRRNRILFRPFILSRFSTYMVLPKFRSEMIPWKGDKARILDPWLAEVDRNDDADLCRRLYEWKLTAKYNLQVRDERSEEISRELLARYRSADTSGKRQRVLRKFDLWFQLSEDTACALYEIDPKAAGTFVLRHLSSSWLGGDKRKLWNRLVALADAKKDEDFRWKLYRRQVSQVDWAKDCLELCDRIRDAAELVREMQKRHPEGWRLNLAESFYRIVERRGRDVFPYLMRHLRSVWGGWFTRGSYGKMADYAREKVLSVLTVRKNVVELVALRRVAP